MWIRGIGAKVIKSVHYPPLYLSCLYLLIIFFNKKLFKLSAILVLVIELRLLHTSRPGGIMSKFKLFFLSYLFVGILTRCGEELFFFL